MPFSTLVLGLFVGLSVAGYTLEDDYVSDGHFFDKFTFFTGADPTGGFVQYVDQSTASSNGYINVSSSSVYIGTDYTHTASASGRQSVRLTSNKAYDSGLIILDLAHMPGGICGTWPAFWTVGPNWPAGGEIDIIEGVNEQSANDMTLHTSQGCQINGNGGFTGNLVTTDCWVNDPNQSNNAGCQIASSDSSTYGSGFNANNGGVYATEYNSSVISIYFFPRGSIPSDISSASPDPSKWPAPVSRFTGCNVGQYIKSQQIVFDLTFCGQWAGAVWSSGSCASKAATCNAFVQNNPSAFQNAYWKIDSLRVYQNDITSSNVVVSSSATSSMTTSSAVASSSAVTSRSSVASSSAVTSSSAAASSSAVTSRSSVATSSSARTNSSSISPTPSSTFAISTSSAAAISMSTSRVPIPPSGTASFSANNATNPTSRTSSSNAVTAPLSTGTGIITSAPVVAASGIASSSPSASLSLSSTAAEASSTYSWHWRGSHHHGSSATVDAKRHLQQHQRHAAGRL